MPEVMTKSQTQITQPSQHKIAVLVVAAGRGSRAGGGLPKQYRSLAGKMVLTRTVEAVASACPGALVQAVIHPDDKAHYDSASENMSLLAPVFGGESRQESVFLGLKALASHAPDFVLVHDGARPFASKITFDAVLAALADGADAAIPGVAVVDTLKKADSGNVSHTVDRTYLFAVQTPQGFAYQALLAAHESAAGRALTDDAAVMEAAGHSVKLVPGEEQNFKLTTAADFNKADQMIMMAQGDIRTGMGYDVHRFEDGDHVWLCGVQIPFTKGLKGHSDADVGLHALTDAILAAIVDGDIGQHFPPSDNKWRGAASDVFLTFARDRVAAKGGSIAHVSVCLICERPKIGPHNIAMRTRIADLLQISVERVSVQATTTEKLGFTGREEGIAAQATATVRLPFGEL